jgi:hypothetical protein
VCKAGTSLRKCRLGSSGRFSTDLDFAAPDEDMVLQVCAAVDQASVSGFLFRLDSSRGDGRHWTLTVLHPELGRPNIGASLEFARRPLALEPEWLRPVSLPVHRAYEVPMPALPVVAEAEACAEKLARYRRISLGRDIYDLAQLAARPMNEPLVRRLWVLKAWADVVDDGKGDRPLDPADVLTPRSRRDLAMESIGKLTKPVKLIEWGEGIRPRFAFLRDLDEDEARWLACDPRHRAEVESALRSVGAEAQM